MIPSWKPFERSLLLIAAEFKRVERESVEDDGRSGRPNDDTADKNVKIVYILVVCNKTCEA